MKLQTNVQNIIKFVEISFKLLEKSRKLLKVL